MHHLLVTNDFPPKTGGIQTYLWELWRRLPPDSFTVVTPDQPGAQAWDAAQPFAVERVNQPFLVPTAGLARRINGLIARTGAGLVLLDPVANNAPLVGRLNAPWGVIVHGAEVTIPAATPGGQLLIRRLLRTSQLVIAAGSYPAQTAQRAAGRPLPVVEIPPGVDTERFVPLDASRRAEVRRRFDVAPDAPLVVSVSRLVPRKGMAVLVEAAAEVSRRYPDLEVIIAGEGRDHTRLQQLVATTGAPVRLVGRVPADDLPGLLGAADVFAMLCHNRWGGLEQEGFGIVFLEAAACGVPQVAGASGGAADAVVHDHSGLVVDEPRKVAAAVDALDTLLGDAQRRVQMGKAARRRAEVSFNYDTLAHRLATAIASAVDNGAHEGSGQ
jgi:phosphatidylinositol alpha-1,6-mannosyltransferase